MFVLDNQRALRYDVSVQLGLFPQPSPQRQIFLFFLRCRIRVRHFINILPLYLAALQYRARRAFIYSIASFPQLRQLTRNIAIWGVPIAIAIGFGVQSISPMRQVFSTTVCFAVAALLTAILVLLVEDLRPDKAWAKVVVLTTLELAIFGGFHKATRWVQEQARETAWSSMSNDAAWSHRDASNYRIIAQALRNPQITTTPMQTPAIAQITPLKQKLNAPEPKPNISLRLVYRKGFAALLYNSGNVLLHEPTYFPVLWDLDIKDRTDPLPAPTWTSSPHDWVRPGEFMGPQPIISLPNVESIVKQGDRIFGVIYVTCSDCAETKWYWVYSVLGENGWYIQFPQGTGPRMHVLFESLAEIKQNTEAFVATIEGTRLPITEME